MASGDFDGDLRTDLAVVDAAAGALPGGGLAVLLGDGDGTFGRRLTYGVTDATSVAPGGFNGDGDLDLAVGTSVTPPVVAVLIGNGNGTFLARSDYVTGTFPLAVVAADLSGDHALDLAVADSSSDTVSVLLGNGNGRFRPHVDYATGKTPAAVAAADLNGDGTPDLMVADSGGDSVSVLLGAGGGTFQSRADYATGSAPSSVAIGDLNGDGNPDAVTANTVQTGTVSTLIGNGDGTFQLHADYSTGDYPASVIIDDFNGDGRLDLAAADSNPLGNTPNAVSVLLGNGDGTFQPHVDYSTGQNPGDPVFVADGDFNADGTKDLIVSNLYRGTVGVLLGNGDGTFQPHLDSAGGGSSVAVGDFDGDGKLDVVTTSGVFGSDVALLLGSGDGTFGAPVTFQVGSSPMQVVAGDFNGDQALDAAAANELSASVSVLLNTGGTRSSVASSMNPSHLGQDVTFTATVAASISDVGTPSGTVTFLDGAMTLGTVPLSDGQAELITSSLGLGMHRITARYDGNATFNPRTSKVFEQRVRP